MSTQAIFLSYASQDADTARRICDVLRAAGLEVWFDQSELRGGDAWDASIRKHIKECALFVPMISSNTQARQEGYFRLEWKLAVDRTHLMADSKSFLVPIVIDDTPEPTANVPDKFRERQWSRLNDEKSIAVFAERVAMLVAAGVPSRANAPASAPQARPVEHHGSIARPAGPPHFFTATRIAIGLVVAALAGAGVYLAIQNKASTAAGTSATINPLSVMVMPFANQTGDKEKAYIADALTSNITSDLSRIRDAFIVPAATAFILQGKSLTIPQLGKEAAVRFVLTGSVTGDKEKLRINAVLSDTQTGAQLWTEFFDGKQSDLFALQDQVTTRIGNSIGPQMVIVAARESEKRASTPQVADLLMRAAALAFNQQSLKNYQAREALFRQALVLEPGNLNAKIGLAITLASQSGNFADELKLDGKARIALVKQAADLAGEVKLVDPNIADIYNALTSYALITNDLESGLQAARKRVELEPKNPQAHNALGSVLRLTGDIQGAKIALGKALQFTSPVRRPTETYANLARVAFIEDRLDESIKWAQQAIEANPAFTGAHVTLALAYARKGDLARARKAAAEAKRLNSQLRLRVRENPPWPGKEAAFEKYIETQFLPAWRLAGLPEAEQPVSK